MLIKKSKVYDDNNNDNGILLCIIYDKCSKNRIYNYNNTLYVQ